MQRSKIVTKEEVEGVPEAKVTPYGALCKSLVHESFQHPGKEAYMRPRTSMKPTRPAADLGHLGLGPEHSQTRESPFSMHARTCARSHSFTQSFLLLLTNISINCGTSRVEAAAEAEAGAGLDQ